MRLRNVASLGPSLNRRMVLMAKGSCQRADAATFANKG